jgi:hypothetical protein
LLNTLELNTLENTLFILGACRSGYYFWRNFMTTYIHHVSGFFAQRDEANNAVEKVIAQGIARERVQIYSADSPVTKHEAEESSNKVLKDVLVDGGIGTAVGTGIGALIQVGLIAANVTLFIASPLIAPLVLLGWGASIGGVVGASIGAAENAKPLSALVEDAIKSGQIVVVVETHSEAETAIAQEVIKASIGDYKDVAA